MDSDEQIMHRLSIRFMIAVSLLQYLNYLDVDAR